MKETDNIQTEEAGGSDAVQTEEPGPEDGGKHAKHGHGRKHGTVKTPQTPEPGSSEDRLLRLQADFDNFRKRVGRERDDISRRANEQIVSELLPALDHLDLALESAREHGEDGNSVVEGFRLVADQLVSALGKFGLEPIDAAGAEFDPEIHEAISRLHSDEIPENRVITQVRKGYKFGPALLRPAQVVVSGGPAG